MYEMAKLPERIKTSDKLRVQLFTPTDVLSDYYQADTALDPKIEWPLIADYDTSLVVATHECMTIPTAQHSESR